jgi:hypothetical protein
MRESAFAAKTKGYRERLSTFASFILPFYDRAESEYFDRLKGQGAFRAFEIICTLPEPVLVIVISDGENNPDGLAEGAKNARILNHQVILAFLAAHGAIERTSISSVLERQDVAILRCSPKELARAINAEVAKLGHSRTIRNEPTGWK